MDKIVIPLSFGELKIEISCIGEDILAVLYGGDKPHIGCTVLAVPRESLTGDGSISCTSSVINVIGHKDEEICRYMAEKLCVKYNAVCVCTGGFHKDDITKSEIEELVAALAGKFDKSA